MSSLRAEPCSSAPALSPLGHERLLVSSDVNFTTYFFLRDKLPTNMKLLVFFCGKPCSDRRKNLGCGQKKPKSTNSAIFGVKTAAKSCELKRCADRIRKFLSPKLHFSPSTKKTTEYSFELFFPLTNLFFTFVVFACFALTRVNMRFRAKNTGFSTGLYPVTL